jgi:HTH-type transcriptional regulator / antitoxin HigA
METVNAFPANPDYTDLLSRIPPKVIRTEEENEHYIHALYELEQRPESLSAEEKELSDLLSLIIADFEERRYRLPHASQAEVIEFLLDQHGVGAEDLSDILAGLNEILSGERELTTHEIRQLSERFHVSPEVFF